MKPNKLLQSIVVSKSFLNKGDKLTHCHDFYEFLFIESGNGFHTINELKKDYTENHLFFVNRNAEHSLEAIENTSVYLIKFTEECKLVLRDLVLQSNGRANGLLKARSPFSNRITFSHADLQLTKDLLAYLFQLAKNPLNNENLIYYQLICLVSLIERNVDISHDIEKKSAEINDIIKHISKNIKQPQFLTVAYLAKKFNIAETYFGIYFKRNTNQPLKSYIQNLRFELIAHEIKKESFTPVKLTYEFGFTDESHFNKAFKKHFGIAPSVYKIKTRSDI